VGEIFLAEALHRQGRMTEAEIYLRDGYDGLTAGNGVDQQTLKKARERIARYYIATNQREKLNELQVAVSHDITPTPARPN
jgi:hypothetical protein